MPKIVRRKIGFFIVMELTNFVTDCIIVSLDFVNSDMEAQHEPNPHKIFLQKVLPNDVATEK